MELNDKQLNKLENGREYRAMVMEVRAVDGTEENMIVEGYATTFNQPYLLYDGRYYKVIEQIAPTAFTECDMSDVIMQYDHAGRVFARTRNSTLTLTVDAIGLKVTADLSGTDIGQAAVGQNARINLRSLTAGTLNNVVIIVDKVR